MFTAVLRQRQPGRSSPGELFTTFLRIRLQLDSVERRMLITRSGAIVRLFNRYLAAGLQECTSLSIQETDALSSAPV